MAEATVVREEVWFDSSDGVSRIHGYVWWPVGIMDEAEVAARGVDVSRASGDEGSSSDVRHEVGAPGELGPRHAAEAVGGEEGENDSGDDAPDEAEAPIHDTISNALEAAARSVAFKGVETEDDGTSRGAAEASVVAATNVNVVEADAGFVRPADGETALPDDDFADAVEVKGIVQLVHGMAEHIGRYDEFARFLADNGYIVCGHDHIGHGGSSAPERLGCIPARRGKSVLVSDVGRLRSIMQERLGSELPYFLFGHSLGSFVVRSYIAREGAGLAGVVICGTGHVPPSKSALGHFVCRLVGVLRGQNAKSALLHSIGVGSYVKSVRHRRTSNDWLSYSEANVDAYNDDELCGFRFSAGGYATVTALTREVCTPAWAARVPRLLPMLFIGGNADPVGDNGEGVRVSAQLVRDAGCYDVTCMIYKHMRHEILNEDDRQMVFDDVLFWLEVRS